MAQSSGGCGQVRLLITFIGGESGVWVRCGSSEGGVDGYGFNVWTGKFFILSEAFTAIYFGPHPKITKKSTNSTPNDKRITEIAKSSELD